MSSEIPDLVCPETDRLIKRPADRRMKEPENLPADRCGKKHRNRSVRQLGRLVPRNAEKSVRTGISSAPAEAGDWRAANTPDDRHSLEKFPTADCRTLRER